MSKQTPSSPRTNDVVVNEVRAIRRRLWDEGGRSVRGYFRVMDEMTARRVAAKGARTTTRRRSA